MSSLAQITRSYIPSGHTLKAYPSLSPVYLQWGYDQTMIGRMEVNQSSMSSISAGSSISTDATPWRCDDRTRAQEVCQVIADTVRSHSRVPDIIGAPTPVFRRGYRAVVVDRFANGNITAEHGTLKSENDRCANTCHLLQSSCDCGRNLIG